MIWLSNVNNKEKNNQMIPGHKNIFILWNLQKQVFPTFKNGAFVCNIAVAQHLPGSLPVLAFVFYWGKKILAAMI